MKAQMREQNSKKPPLFNGNKLIRFYLYNYINIGQVEIMESKQKSSGPEKTQNLKSEAPSTAPDPDSAQTDFGRFVAGFVFGVTTSLITYCTMAMAWSPPRGWQPLLQDELAVRTDCNRG